MDFPCLRQTHSGSCELMKWTDVCPVQRLSDLRCKRRTERWTTDGGYVLAIRRLDEHADRFLHGRSQPVHHSGQGPKVGPGEASRQHNTPFKNSTEPQNNSSHVDKLYSLGSGLVQVQDTKPAFTISLDLIYSGLVQVPSHFSPGLATVLTWLSPGSDLVLRSCLPLSCS